MNKERGDVIIILSLILFLSIVVISLGYLNFRTTGYAIDNQTTNAQLILSLRLQPESLKVKPGETLFFLLDIRESGFVDETSTVNLKYTISDLKGNIISFKEENGELKIKESQLENLLIPTDTKPGVYIASVEVEYNGQIYTTKKTFEVDSKGFNLNILAYVLASLVFLALVYWVIRKIRKKYYY